jgi:hypothetical protein
VLNNFHGEASGAAESRRLPGSEMPNLTLYPPDGLALMGNPTTVTTPTNLDQLLSPDMGNVQWAACCNVR